MAHYRSTLCLLTCLACLGAAFSPSADGRPQTLNASYRAVSQEIAQADDRPDSKAPKPSPVADKNKSKPSQPPKSNSKIPKAISNLIVILSRQRGFLILGLAAVVITAAAVFIMLKLVGNDESNNSRRRGGTVDRRNPRNYRATNPRDRAKLVYPVDFSTGHSLDNSDRSLPSLLESGASESENAGLEGDRINARGAPSETNSNGYRETGFNVPETTNRGDSLATNKKKNISLAQTDDTNNVDIIEALIEDLQHRNPAYRRKAIWELGQQGDSRAVEPLLDLLANSDSNQYSLILASVSEIGIRTLKPMNNAWSISLQNENPEVRKNAIRDLTRIYEMVNQISYLLHRATNDQDAEVQETARWAINQLNRIHPRSERDD
ncbi:HEAT repeat domain-containing protein [Tychonema sp. LEGE 07199]|nr:HEAT repeat domain-containing protein [Tychonema sp. LEGE 07199]MBE9134195.1 HEAT repeat domain-containing protein [Tychonema sp. LEGE 07196]